MRLLKAFLIALLPVCAQAAPWYLDRADSRIAVDVGWLGDKSVTVRFDSFDGQIDFDERRPHSAKATITVGAANAETGLGIVNRLVRSKDYLDTRRFPHITFQLDRLVRTSESTADITGRITLRGVTRPVTFKADVFRYGPSARNADVFEAGFNLRGQIDRREFGSTGGLPDVAAILPIRIRLVMQSAPV